MNRLLLILLCLVPTLIFSQIDTITPKKKKWPFSVIQKLQEGNLKFIPIPAFSVSPEKGVSFGLILEYFFNTADSANKKQTRLSNAYVNLQYSTLKQGVAELVYSIYTNKEKYYLQGAIGFKDFYERYWTFSEDTVDNKNFRGLTYQQLYLRGKVLKQYSNQLFVGVNYNVNQHRNITFESKATPAIPNVIGLNKSFVVGIGPLLIIDKRDNQFSPQKGWYGEVGARFHQKTLGSRFNYSQYQLDVRRYIVTKPKGILALHATTTLHGGDVPFLEKQRLGSDKIMRGYFAGRFRDNQFAAAQIEYRYPIGKSFIITAFASAGQTAPTIPEMHLQNMQSSVGGGFRYLANKEKLLYLRFDAGYTKQGNWGFYINLGDAF